MSAREIITAEFVSYKHIATRKAFQIILEVPEESQREVFKVLGYPNSSQSLQCAVVRLMPQVATPPADDVVIPEFMNRESLECK